MNKKLLIDASHAEETRVVVLEGNRLEDFDVETATRKQIKGNIYLAKVIRVEPSLQAAFVEYGGNRHGFLAFGEIHPDYYQIPVADRQRLLAQQAEDADEEDEAEEAQANAIPPVPELIDETSPSRPDDDTELQFTASQPLEITSIGIVAAPPPFGDDTAEIITTETISASMRPNELNGEPIGEPSGDLTDEPDFRLDEKQYGGPVDDLYGVSAAESSSGSGDAAGREEQRNLDPQAEFSSAADPLSEDQPTETQAGGNGAFDNPDIENGDYAPAEPPPESMGGDGDDAAEARERRQRQRFLRNYKIQEVIHRRQIMLIQVVKEERGNKGAALTTYLSLAGRFSVLMPNSPSGGGVSRKITSLADRRRLKEAMAELDVPQGMGLIVRTAGANRPKPEIKRDCEYLLRLWDDIRDRTMASTAPALIYEEASLIKRTIRDVYTRDVEDVLVDGEEGYKAARDFMRMLMPTHAKKVQLWTEGQPLFAKYQVEAQLDAMLNPIVQLRSGGYIVINQTEALVAIDVNSGRSTRERNIEDTAVRTNMEAAEEVARQLRMRDLAGLIVIDFIDMESRKNNGMVERRLKDSLKNDRARIQVGSISHFGLMEMSRQRLRPSLAEASLVLCPHCAGMGQIRSPESAALHILRAIEDEGAKFRAAEIVVFLPPDVALYLFNHKRDRLSAIEARYAMRVIFSGDSSLTAANFRIEKTKTQSAPLPAPAPYVSTARANAEPIELAEVSESDEDNTETEDATTAGEATGTISGETPGETAEEGERRRRRRRRRGKRRGEPGSAGAQQETAATDIVPDRGQAGEPPDGELIDDQPSEIDLVLASELGDQAEPVPPETDTKPARRRRVRGGRRRSGTEMPEPTNAGEQAIPEEPVYADIADIFEAAERAEAEALRVKAHLVVAPQRDPEPEREFGHTSETVLETVSHVTFEPAQSAPPELQNPPLEKAWQPESPEPPRAPEPLVKPTIIGSQEAPLEKKRGWWRR